ncbi:MAG: hypothetical protein AAF628_07185 [Planctomycetota bacterium]
MNLSLLTLATLACGLLFTPSPTVAQADTAQADTGQADTGQADAAEQSPTEIPAELTEHQREMLRLRIELIMEKDQQFRSMLSYGTTDLDEIARIDALSMEQMMAAMADDTRQLDPAIRDLLVQLQQRNDTENQEAFEAIVREFGYPSAERLDMKSVGLFAVLLHPPVELDEIESHLARMSDLLLPEVRAGRMEARLYATFVDNMLAKILRRPQLYGTNQQFDPATNQVLPPRIEDLQKANDARRAIGMPELQAGEYRLADARK